MRKDVCWKVKDGLWMLKTTRSPKQMQKEACAAYFRPDGVPLAWQYRLKRRPKGAEVLT